MHDLGMEVVNTSQIHPMVRTSASAECLIKLAWMRAVDIEPQVDRNQQQRRGDETIRPTPKVIYVPSDLPCIRINPSALINCYCGKLRHYTNECTVPKFREVEVEQADERLDAEEDCAGRNGTRNGAARANSPSHAEASIPIQYRHV
ncbi:hypothetical protein HBH98_167450 [Parastagonospora nodorum]|nr:hypothetical protein HBH52_221580 [Parastagonospora nodorum]KAH4052299.1 hypothetical protein HBH49_099440 [Parastagonospora nodorum]KAH4342124.1 hypothetical protein HBH98_167450 [Parastagonospora nodorum]KAH4367179.1 hypothetical protein HBH97_162380 [Parastagonospora nodorum]KAH4389441.1 hypothetical protein HBH99_159420 [Parastagonospora nodorum]